MPYKEGDGYRGSVVYKGIRETKRFKRKKDANHWENKRKRELKKLYKRRAIRITSLSSTYSTYLNDVKARHRPVTYKEKRYLGQRMISLWGDADVLEITPEDINTFLLNRKNKLSAHAANKDRKNILAFYGWLKRIKGTIYNPITQGEIRPFAVSRSPQYVPTQEQVLRLLAAAQGQDRVMLICFLNTAARKSEILRWRWDEDINFDVRKVRLGTRKTRDGSMRYDWLPMNDTLYEALWGHYQKRLKESPWVFPNLDKRSKYYGQRYTARRKWMKSLCKRAGLKPAFGLHALRRYVASVLADTHKASAKAIQRILRHSNVSTTEGYIGNVSNDMQATLELLEKGEKFEKKTFLHQSDTPEKGKGSDREA